MMDFKFDLKDALHFDFATGGGTPQPPAPQTPSITIRSNSSSGSSYSLQYRAEYFDLSCINFAGVTSGAELLRGFGALKAVTFGSADFRTVATVSSMFGGCTSLLSVDFSGVDFSSVTNMSGMFEDCYSLTSAVLPSSHPTTLISIFSGCYSLKTADLSGVISSPASCYAMFKNCYSLEVADLSGLTLEQSTPHPSMFDNVPSTCQIITKDSAQQAVLAGWFPDRSAYIKSKEDL